MRPFSLPHPIPPDAATAPLETVPARSLRQMPTPLEPLAVRPFWSRILGRPLFLALLLFLALNAFRVYGYFASDTIKGPVIMLGFVLMWFAPLACLTAWGRHQIGLQRPRSLSWILIAILAGSAAAYLCYALGLALFGKSEQHWFVSVGYAFQSDPRVAAMSRLYAFIAFTIPAMIASPIGEEFLFRGILQEAGRDRFSFWKNACLAAALFALVHLVHHGVYRHHGSLEIMPLSGSIWFVLMFALSLVFSLLRRKSGSIWTAVAAHSAFNLVMNLTIFYSLLVMEPQVALAAP